MRDTDAFRRLIEPADDIVRSNLGYGLERLFACGSESDFKATLRECAGLDQICNFLAGVHCAALLRERGETAAVVMGHSAGEFAALAVADALRVEEGLDLVVKRIAALATHRHGGGMLVVNADVRRVESLVAALASPRLQISVINHQEQVAVSGQPADLARLRDLAAHLHLGALLLPSEYPFHSKLLEPAVAPFARLLGDAALREPAIPVYSPLERAFYGPGRLAEIVPFHLVRPLDYQDAVTQIHGLGIRTFVDCSTGGTPKGNVERVLAGKQATVKSGFDGVVLAKAPLRTRDVSPVPARANDISSAAEPVADAPLPRADEREVEADVPIAIVGLGCVLPGARNPDQLWDNVSNGVSGIVDMAEVSPPDAVDFLS